MDQGTKEFTKVTLFLPIKEQAEDLNVTEDGFFRTDELKAEDLLNLLEDVSSRLEASRVLRMFQKSLQEIFLMYERFTTGCPGKWTGD